jgi:predicted small secreted protein
MRETEEAKPMTTRSAFSRLAVLACLSAALGLSACNTVKGAGTDIKKTGDTIEDTAEKAKP